MLEVSLWERALIQEGLESFLLEDQGNQEDLDLLLVGRCPPLEGFSGVLHCHQISSDVAD